MGQGGCLTQETFAGYYILLRILSELPFTLSAMTQSGLGVVEQLLFNLFNLQVLKMFCGEQI